MIVEDIEEEMRQHADEMRAHHAQAFQDNKNIVRRQKKRAMNLDKLNEREIQLCKHDSNQGQAQSHEHGGFSSNGMNSMKIDHVLQTSNDRVEDLMNVDLGNYNLQHELTSQIRRQRQLKRKQNRMDKGTINTIQNNGIDLRTLQIMF